MMNEVIFINFIVISCCWLLIKFKELYLLIIYNIMYVCIMNILIDFYYLLIWKLLEIVNCYELFVKYIKY